MQQKRQRVGPKVPNGAKRRGEKAEKQRRPTRRAQQHINARLTLSLTQAEEKQRPCGGETVGAVQRPGKARQSQPEGTQQIVDQSGGQTQQDGLEEKRKLLADVDAHIIPADGAAVRRVPPPAPRRKENPPARPRAARRRPARAGRCAAPRR